MEKSLCFGLAIGMVAGALLAVNSFKVRKLVCDGQRQMRDVAKRMAEEKNDQQGQAEE